MFKEAMSNHVVEVQNLSRRFDKLWALEEVNFTIQPGLVYGLVGANGAGKTTLIKHLLGLLKAKQGLVRVFGLDPVAHPVEVLSRIGYLSEERDLPEWMRIDEFLSYSAAYYPGWDHQYAASLIATFGLDVSKRIKQLSKGMRAQVGLVAAVAHHPQLLVLDEPSTGLDAVVRKDILNAVIREVADNGRTAIFSSHLLDEVELMSDQVLMFHQGKLLLFGSVEQLREQHHRLEVRFATERTQFPDIEGLLSAEHHGQYHRQTWSLVCHGDASEIQIAIAAIDGEIAQMRSASLQEIFVSRAGRAHQVEV